MRASPLSEEQVRAAFASPAKGPNAAPARRAAQTKGGPWAVFRMTIGREAYCAAGCSVLARLAFPSSFQLKAGRLIDDLHRQAHLAAIVDAEQLHEDLSPSLTTSLTFGDALLRKLRDVDEAVLRAEEVHEGAEVHDLDDLAFVDLADPGSETMP